MKFSSPRIALFSKGRSHLWDLFLALHDLKANVSFYTDVPIFRLGKFGMTNQSVKSVFPQSFPYFIIHQLKLRNLQDGLNRRWIEQMDSTVAKTLPPCDLFIGLSGLSLKSPKVAKSKYGAQVWIERGSVHILEQKEILEKIQKSDNKITISNWAIERELEGYELADRIVVPSTHVAQSFYDKGIKKEKLFVNGYGVNLSDFPVTHSPQNNIPTVLFVGGWSFQKGCDLLNEIILGDQSFQLIHAGDKGDCEFPKAANFKSLGHVFQKKLSKHYGKADIVVLPSRQEGQSLVLSQALASGVPIVCSPKSGGKDLLARLGYTPTIKVLSDLNLDTLKTGITEQLDFASTLFGMRDLLGEKRDLLSWRGCAKTYLEEIHQSFGSPMTLSPAKVAQN